MITFTTLTVFQMTTTEILVEVSGALINYMSMTSLNWESGYRLDDGCFEMDGTVNVSVLNVS